MSKTYLPYEPDQQLLLPAALQEWLPDDHLAIVTLEPGIVLMGETHRHDCR